jgi:ADP-ribose pyrophosphatase
MSKNKFHLTFGVYGIIAGGNRLLVVKKNGGPYNKRYDLPGGKLGHGESLVKAVKRAVNEETGLEVLDVEQLGTVNFRYPWKQQHFEWNEHVCVFYRIDEYSGIPNTDVSQFIGQNPRGTQWIEVENLNLENSSPLVLKAKEFILLHKFIVSDTKFSHWDVLD